MFEKRISNKNNETNTYDEWPKKSNINFPAKNTIPAKMQVTMARDSSDMNVPNFTLSLSW
jgi:hypothetical protein